MGKYFAAQGQVTLKRIIPPGQLVPDFMPVLNIYKFEEVGIKTEGAMAQITFSTI